MTDLSCTDYSEKAIVVRGNTKEYKDQLKSLGGKFNANLRDGAGWIFPKKDEDKVLSFVMNGKVEKTVKPEIKNNDVLKTVEQSISKMTLKERLSFIREVARLADTCFEKVEHKTNTLEKPSVVKTNSKTSVELTPVSFNSEDSDSSDVEVPHFKKLL
jgi:hypothetical protein